MSPDAVDAMDDVPQRRPTSFARFMRDIMIIAALLAGGMYAYRKHVVTKEEVGKIVTQASDKLEKDDLESLKEAEGLYKQILELDSDSDKGLLGLAEAYFYQSQHGLPTRAQAEEHLAKAIAENTPRPERYALDAYLKITSGNAQTAERELKELMDKDIGSSKIAHAYGWAHAEQGNYIEAKRVIDLALQTDFNAVRFAMTIAEISHRQGEERQAVKWLRTATGQQMNPKHEVALAWLAALSAKNYGNIATPAKLIQDVQARKDALGPRAVALLTWAEGELALAVGNAAGAVEKAEEALTKQKDFPPFLDLKARALVAQRKMKDAFAVYEQAIQAKPEYRGIKLDLIELKSQQKDDSALAMIDELQKAVVGTPGPELEILRGEHYLYKGDVEQAKAAFTRAADLGDDPAILFGLAKVAFLEEKKKDNKADLERVAQAFEQTIERRSTYPEAHDYMGTIALWNFDIAGANTSFTEAETQYKKLNRPMFEMVKFYDHVVDSFNDVKDKRAAGEANKLAGEWKKKKDEFLATAVTAGTE